MDACSSVRIDDDLVVKKGLEEMLRLVNTLSDKVGTLKGIAKENSTAVSVASLRVKEDLQRSRMLIDKFEKESSPSAMLSHSSEMQSVPEDLSPVNRNSVTLLDRIGGSSQLKTIVTRVYNRFSVDPRLRAFFEKSPTKVRYIQDKLFQFLEGYLSGGTVNSFDLKTPHYHLNITDYHVDAFLGTFADVMREIGIDSDTITEFVSHVGKVRTDITTGYTIRCELARINTNQLMCESSLCDRIGGLDGVIQFIDRLYDIIAKDDRISAYFVGHNFERIKHGQRAYITELIGGPKLYRGRTLEEIHVNLGIDDYLFDCYVQDAQLALKLCGVAYDLSDQVLIQLESARAAVVGKHRGAAEVINLQPVAKTDAGLFSSNYSGVSGVSFASSSGGSGVVSASLFLKLGDSEMLKQIVSDLVEQCSRDKRVSDFFNLSNVERRRRFELGFLNCLLTVSGGPVMYDLTQLREAHYNLNITDVHFDAFMSNFKKACLGHMEPEVVNRLVCRLSKLRSEITAGFTIRSHLSSCPFRKLD